MTVKIYIQHFKIRVACQTKSNIIKSYRQFKKHKLDTVFQTNLTVSQRILICPKVIQENSGSTTNSLTVLHLVHGDVY